MLCLRITAVVRGAFKSKIMSNLQLSLKKEWFKMTKSGTKTEDYREITPYWCARLIDDIFKDYNSWKEILDDSGNDYFVSFLKNRLNNFKQFDINTMTLGYPKTGDTERVLKLEHKGIEIKTGNPDWGAEPNKLYFVIMHGVSLN